MTLKGDGGWGLATSLVEDPSATNTSETAARDAPHTCTSASPTGWPPTEPLKEVVWCGVG